MFPQQGLAEGILGFRKILELYHLWKWSGAAKSSAKLTETERDGEIRRWRSSRSSCLESQI